MPSLLILIPLFGLIILNLPFRNLMRRLAFWFAFVLFCTQVLVAAFHQVPLRIYQLEWLDSFFKIGLAVDHLAMIMFFCIGIVSLSSLLVARYTIPDEKDRFKFINLLITTSIGLSGIVMVKDIFSLYVFLEIAAVSSFILIAFDKNINALEGAFKYLILSAIATILMLSAIGLFLLSSGSTSFGSIAEALKNSQSSALSIFAMTIFMCGLFIKGGLVPFHGWLPDAYMSAPSPVSVLLAGVVTKTAGIYTTIRIVSEVFVFGEPVKNMLMIVGLISIVVGAFAALGQNDFKRMLAYSSISQVGYIILGFGAGTVLGLAGAVFHLFNHAVFKSLLFVNSAAVEKQLGTNDMNKMGGLSQKMPLTGATSVIGFLSTCGIPPLSGFWSKIIIVIALWQAGYIAYSVIAILASILTLAYFLSMQRRVFFGKLRGGLEELKEANFGLVLTSSILAIITVGVGLFFPVVFNYFIMPVKEIFIK